MEMPEQELPVIFSQMLQMFPNIPQDIIWLNVQQYSRDIEKCAQMLNQQNSKYTELKSTLNTNRNLNECNNVLQAPYFRLHSETTLDNNNDVPLSTQLPLNSEDDVIQKCITDRQQTEEITHNSSESILDINNPVDSSKNLRETKFINFNEPLILDIVPDDDDISHSWRPNVTADALCSDLFAPSPMSQNFHPNSNMVHSLNFEQIGSGVIMNPEGMIHEEMKSNNSVHMPFSYIQQNSRHYDKDIASYLHYQKSQMNVIRYEVIKAKIEQGDLKEEIERLSFELQEKMQSKSVQDIEELNEEIVQLRLDCQCLCSDVDQILNDQGLLGDIDERCYESNSSSNSTGTQSVANAQCTNSHGGNAVNVYDDSDRWQCPKCTFANHSAIKVCEMCSAPKPNTQRPPLLHATSGSCYCHPEEKSLFVPS